MDKIGRLFYLGVIIGLGLMILQFGYDREAMAKEKVFNWKCQESWPRAALNLHDDMWPEFLKCVKRRSKGRLNITSFPVGELIKTPSIPMAISRGIIEMAHTCDAFFAGLIPVGQVAFGLPMSQTCRSDVYALHARGIEDLLREAYAEHGIYFAGSQAIGKWGIVGSNVPIRKLEDFKGVKIRMLGGAGELMRRVGASPVAIAPGELYTAMQLGTVDAIGREMIEWDTDNYHEVSKYQIKPHFITCTESLIVNPDAWNSLPEDVKMIFKCCEREYALRLNVAYETYEAGYEAKIREGALIELPPEEVDKLRKIAVRMWDEVYAKKSPRCKKAVEIVKKYCREQGIIK